MSRPHTVALGTTRRADAVYRGFRAYLPSCAGPRQALAADDHELHVDADAVCPRCLSWIEPGDYVRRTAYGPYQHESC
jgi:hypothetical protein